MKLALLLTLTLATVLVSGEIITNAPFYSQSYARIASARGLMVDETGDILVVSINRGVYALYEVDAGNGTVDVVQQTIINGQGLNLNHAVAYRGGYLYASSASTVYRWPYTPGQRSEVRTEPEIVIRGIPTGGHATRTLAFDNLGLLYVSVGSNANIDSDSRRARIVRTTLNVQLPIEFLEMNVFADGLRNEVGISFDSTGTLWGVENGADNLNRADLGGDIHNNNPAEEMNKFSQAGAFYGYPYCFSTYNLTSNAPGTQFAWPDFMNDGVHTDAWCQNTDNVKKPALAMPAHNAPLGIEFYSGVGCDQSEGAFPCSAIGSAIVSFHGSWNSDMPVGYRVAWFPFVSGTTDPTGEDIDIMYSVNPGKANFRPVNSVFTQQGHLIVSTDSTGDIYKVTYNAPAKPIRSNILLA